MSNSKTIKRIEIFKNYSIEEIEEHNKKDYWYYHEQGHLIACDNILTALRNNKSKKEILKSVSKKLRQIRKECLVIDKLVNKTNNESLWNDNYYLLDSQECCLESIRRILLNKYYIKIN